MNRPLITRGRRPWWLSPFGGAEPWGDVWSDRLMPVWQRMQGEEMDEWEPNFNFYQKDGNYKLEAEIPGVDREDIIVAIENNVLTVRGKKRTNVAGKAKYYLQESAYGHFSRSLQLPGEVEADQVQAKFEDGVLKLTIPRKKTDETSEIKIEG
jgi:HSP20 family protein